MNDAHKDLSDLYNNLGTEKTRASDSLKIGSSYALDKFGKRRLWGPKISGTRKFSPKTPSG